MPSSQGIIPYSLESTPSLIERVLPVQKLSAESYKEQMAVHGKTLTALGSFWKGRKPLILSKACILGALLPATADLKRDLEIYEMLMAMDEESFAVRLGRFGPEEILQRVALPDVYSLFKVDPDGILPSVSPIALKEYRQENGKLPKIRWRDDVPERVRRRLEARAIPRSTYREMVKEADRPESCPDVHDHIWDAVNNHLGTKAYSYPELVEQLGIMRFGHRPRIADTFCGSGQIPFEAARLGCDVYASDLNPVACMLTWGALNIVGGATDTREVLAGAQLRLATRVQTEIDRLGIESDGNGWRAKAYLYCLEVECPSTGWKVPLLPTLVISRGRRVTAELVPDAANKRYDIAVRTGANDEELADAEKGTIRTDGRGQDPYMVHSVAGTTYRTKIATLRGDYRRENGSTANRLRAWNKEDFAPREGDIFQERPYAIQWSRPKRSSKGEEYEFRAVTSADLERERVVSDHIVANIAEWQQRGWIPDMRIEPGDETDRLFRERGWTFWHHLFNPRQLLLAALIRQNGSADAPFVLGQVLNVSCRCTRWDPAPGVGRAGKTASLFDNQAINPLFNYGCRSSAAITSYLRSTSPSLYPGESRSHLSVSLLISLLSKTTCISPIRLTGMQ